MSKSKVRVGATWGMAFAGGMALMAGAAQAQSYNWSFTGELPDTTAGSGALYVTGGFITSFTGTFDGSTISNLMDPNTFYGNDNAFPLSGLGVAFMLANGWEFNLSVGGDGVVLDTYLAYNPNSDPAQGYGTFAATPAGVPEPGTWSLLGVGAAGLIAVRRLRRKSPALAAA